MKIALAALAVLLMGSAAEAGTITYQLCSCSKLPDLHTDPPAPQPPQGPDLFPDEIQAGLDAHAKAEDDAHEPIGHYPEEPASRHTTVCTTRTVTTPDLPPTDEPPVCIEADCAETPGIPEQPPSEGPPGETKPQVAEPGLLLLSAVAVLACGRRMQRAKRIAWE